MYLFYIFVKYILFPLKNCYRRLPPLPSSTAVTVVCRCYRRLPPLPSFTAECIKDCKIMNIKLPTIDQMTVCRTFRSIKLPKMFFCFIAQFSQIAGITKNKPQVLLNPRFKVGLKSLSKSEFMFD